MFSVSVFCGVMLSTWAQKRPWLTRSDDDETPDLEAVMKLIIALFLMALCSYALYAGASAARTLE